MCSSHAIALGRRRRTRYKKTCKHCAKTFETEHKNQKTCSPQCRAIASRRRLLIACDNTQCGRQFEVTPSRYAKGIRCCSNKCKHERMRLPERFCQNPACGKKIEREACGPRKTALGQDSQKYCCHKCYCDHRWGAGRPATGWTAAARKKASAAALSASLRKKCRELGIPDDPECTRLAVCERDGWACQLCGIDCNREYVIDPVTRRPDPRNAEHDHIIATTTPGSPGNVFPNSQCLCRKCNNKKGARSKGQLRLDLEGSVKRWESGARGRRQQNSKSCAATQAAALSTRASQSRQRKAW